MTELENLYFNNENQLRNAIADAVKEEDADALAKYTRFSTRPATTPMSPSLRLPATITLERADVERLVEGDLSTSQTRRSWRSITRTTPTGTTNAMTSAWASLRQLTIHPQRHSYFCAQGWEQKEMRMRIRIGNLLDALMEDKGIKGYAEKQGC